MRAGVEAGIIPAAREAHLASLFAVWLRGVPWGRMRLTHTNRPSLASWRGSPWEFDCVTDVHLSRGVTGTNVKIMTEMIPPMAVAPSLAHRFTQLWSKCV